MIFDSFALLGARPIHEEAIGRMHYQNGDNHVNENTERRNAREETKYQSEAAKEFRHNREKRKRGRDMHPLGEKAHGICKSGPSKPSERFLRAMGEKDHSQYESQNRQMSFVPGSDYFVKHK